MQNSTLHTEPHEKGRKQRKDSVETRSRILSAAVKQLGMYGVAGISLRSVMKEAGANHAAGNYYFGSKEGLITAITEEYLTQKLTGMETLLDEAATLPPGAKRARKLVEAYVRPHIELVIGRGEHDYAYIGLQLMTAGNTTNLSRSESLIMTHRYRFRDALRDCAPDTASSTLSRAVGFVINTMIQAPFDHSCHPLTRKLLVNADTETVVEESIAFAYGGIANLLNIKP